MKIRTDFVTNSSSSSFIFGEPNGNTVTSDDVIEYMQDEASKILKVIKFIEESISTFSEDLRHDITEAKIGDYTTDYLENKITKALFENTDFKSKLESKLNELGLECSPEIVIESYLNNFEIHRLETVANVDGDGYLIYDVEDIRTCSDSSKLFILDTFYYDVPSDIFEECKKDPNLVPKYLGEVVITSDCLPSAITEILDKKLKFTGRC